MLEWILNCDRNLGQVMIRCIIRGLFIFFAIIIEIIINKIRGFPPRGGSALMQNYDVKEASFTVLEILYPFQLHWFTEWFFLLYDSSCYFPSEISSILCSVFAMLLLRLCCSNLRLHFIFNRLLQQKHLVPSLISRD